MDFYILVALGVLGLIITLAGIFMSKYPNEGRFMALRRRPSIESIAHGRLLKPLLGLLTRNKNRSIYRMSQSIIKNSEANISVEALYLLKLTSLVVLAVFAILVRYTNIDVIKTGIISKSNQTVSFMDKKDTNSYAYNLSLYKSIVKKVGKAALADKDNNKKVEAVKKALPGLINSNNSEMVDEKARDFVRTYSAVNNVRLIDWQTLLLIAASFWLPELLLLFRWILLGSSYKKELLKLENIFELLASIRGFKTINILDEMAKSSKSYRRHLIKCRDLFKTEKELALEGLKASVKNVRLSRLVDVIRVYAMSDKSLALQILERNKLEREEEILLTAEEDIDTVDIIAFISIVPVLFELANLLMKPMLDMVYEAFKFI